MQIINFATLWKGRTVSSIMQDKLTGGEEEQRAVMKQHQLQHGTIIASE
jgi:hypothetical protein